jgi:SWI/SNF-related matrix-associated actin-dependent regulator of chromatin subfamily A-like protein 1
MMPDIWLARSVLKMAWRENSPVVGCPHRFSMTSGCKGKNGATLFEQIYPKLRPFQVEALEFATTGKLYHRQWSEAASGKNDATSFFDPSLLGKGRILLADEMGLGKTVTSLAIMAYYASEWPLLILCPASLRYTWPAEIEKFLPSLPPQSIYIAKGFQDVAFTKWKDLKVLIVTYSLFQERSAVQQAISKLDWHCVIADESHSIKSRSSQRTNLILPLLLGARRLALLSGTPALAKPAELWTQLSCLAPKLFGNWTAYATRYCHPHRKSFGGGRYVMEYSGSSNEAELHSKLKQIMVRRLKNDVLQELPPKQRTIVPISIVGQEQLASCKQIMVKLSERRVSAEKLVGQDAHTADFEAKALLMQAFQATGIGKATSVSEYLLDWHAGSAETQKILVFAHHREVLDRMDQVLLSKCPNAHIRIDGSVPPAVRAQLVRKFQTCARVRIALLSITAAGVGLTLTAASTVLFAELHWTPGVMAQAE